MHALHTVYEWLRVPTTANHSITCTLCAPYACLMHSLWMVKGLHHSQSQPYARLICSLWMVKGPHHSPSQPYMYLMCTLHAPMHLMHTYAPYMHLRALRAPMCALHAPYAHLYALCVPTCTLCAPYVHLTCTLRTPYVHLYALHVPTCTLCAPTHLTHAYARLMRALQVYDWLRVPTTANQITDI